MGCTEAVLLPLPLPDSAAPRGRKKMGCAPRARTLPCAPCRNAVDLQSNGERAERLGLHTNAARLPQIGFHAHPLSAFSAQFATTRPRLPRQLSDRGTEVPRGLISYGRRHRSPSCRAGRRSAGASRSGRQEEEDARLRRPVSNVQQPSRKVDVAAVGAEGCCREALPAGDRVAARQLHLRST